MRKTILAGLLVVVCATAYVGCDTQQQANPAGSVNDVITASPAAKEPSGLKMPEGTTYEEVTVAGEREIRFKLPEGYTLLARSTDGETTNVEEGGIRCKCTSGSGCNPFKVRYGGQTYVGCSMEGTCTECTGSASLTTPEGETETVPLRNAVLLDRRQPISLVRTRAQAAGRSCATDVLLSDPAVMRDLAAAVAPYMGSNPTRVRAESYDPSNKVLRAPFDVYGHTVWLPVSAELRSLSEGEEGFESELVWDRYFGDPEVSDNVEDGGGSCRCRAGGRGCVYDRKGSILGSIEYCKANGCTDCELS